MSSKHKKHRLDDQPAYRSWVKARDRALEDIHTRAQLESADILRAMFADVLKCASNYYHASKHSDQAIHEFENWTQRIFAHSTERLNQVLQRLKKSAYVLAKSSEVEIIARLLKSPVHLKIDHSEIERLKSKASLAGGPMLSRTKLYMDRLRRKIISQAQSSALNAPDEKAFLFDVAQSFPKRRVIKVPRRILKPQLMEADQSIGSGASVAIDTIDDKTWQEMLDDYMDEYVPTSREPEYVVDIPIADPTIQKTTGEEVWYAWEFERDMTNEFVSSVRDGQIEGANDAGITDFVWIAVVDSKTDECCLWRDGLLVSEIEAQLGDHEGEDEECNLDGDGLTPPIHFNCRCTLAPATDNIPEKPDDGLADFQDWLNS